MSNAEILADSIGPHGHRLTSFLVTYPRLIMAEVNTHRAISKSSASSRAIPVEKMLRAVADNPFVPATFGKNQRGMQAGEDLDAPGQFLARRIWLEARDLALHGARALLDAGVHKQLANRLLEPFAWTTTILSATDWENFYALRTHPDAQPEFQAIARMMRQVHEDSTPTLLQPGEWHLPLVRPEERAGSELYDWAQVSAGRCARVSYLTHDGRRDPGEDLALGRRIRSAGHMGPFEHPAMCMAVPERVGNLTGFYQLRKYIPGEAVFRPGGA